MHRLVRQVRFSITPFSKRVETGANSYASKPCGEGLSLFLGLWVEVAGPVDPDTGFVINVTEIDRLVRRHVVPIFKEMVGRRYGKAQSVSLGDTSEALRSAWRVLQRRLPGRQLTRLGLDLTPFRRLEIMAEDAEMVYFSEKFEFAAMHTLWNPKFSKRKNLEVFGRCANPTGHGHNYVLEVVVETPQRARNWSIGRFETIVDKEFISLVDHRNLNVDLRWFHNRITTVENIAAYAWQRLQGKFGQARLAKVTVWETDKTYCSYTAENPAVESHK